MSKKCLKCSNEAELNKLHCKSCLFKKTALRATRASKNSQLLIEMLQKNPKCPYTGLEITYENSNIDHILPEARGGDKSIENVEWISELANNIKSNLTKEEFISFCNLVAMRHPINKSQDEIREELKNIPMLNTRKGNRK